MVVISTLMFDMVPQYGRSKCVSMYVCVLCIYAVCCVRVLCVHVCVYVCMYAVHLCHVCV